MKSLMRNETGAALVTAILVLMLATGLTLGMFAALTSSSRSQAADRDQSVAYAAAHAGLEKLTSSLADLFVFDFSPNAGQIATVDAIPPAIPGFVFTAPGGAAGSGYDITFTADDAPGNVGNPKPLPNADIVTGPFEGFKGLITPYTLTVTARSTTGNSEVRLRRELQTVAVPVFQFGIFGQTDLGFHAGPNFDFGGRVHTNGSLFLAQGNGNTLTFRDKITAVVQVVRNRISNGAPTEDTSHDGTVSVPRVIGTSSTSYRNLLKGESSGTITGPCISSGNTTDSRCWNSWKNLSEVTYAANIRTAATGAKSLNLPIATGDATPIDLIRRPVPNENATAPQTLSQRYYTQASLRILLSDRASDIMDLPGIVTGTPPLDLTALGAAYTPSAGTPFLPPVALSPGANETRDATDGVALTRVRDINHVTAGDIRFTTATSSGGTFGNALVPDWLKWSSLVHADGATLTTFTCLGFTPPRTLNNCNHPSTTFNNGTTVTITPGDGSPAFTGTLSTTSSSSSSNDIQFTTGFRMQQKLAFTRGFFVGEDVVVCTGISGTGTGTNGNRLTGCTTTPNAPSGETNNFANTIDSGDPVYTGSTLAAGTPLINGFIKIEQQRPPATVGGPPVWADVTTEILGLGFAGPNEQGDDCGDPTDRAIIRLQRLRDNGYTSDMCSDDSGDVDTTYHNSMRPTDYWPNLLFDAREGFQRLRDDTDGLYMAGLMGYVAFDANNFRRWVAGTFGSTGTQTFNNNGYIIYFSDRRGDHNESHATIAHTETGEFGNEDSINHGAFAWAKNNALDAGENFNQNRTAPLPGGTEILDTYGETPHPLAIPASPLDGMGFEDDQRPWSTIPLKYTGRGRLARPILFRRALKIINGGLNQLPTAGISIVAENPIYVQGNFNATHTPTTGTTGVQAEPNVPAAIMGDSITLLSRNFRDTMTFQYPQVASMRPASTTGYRFAMVTGKTIPFPKPSWATETNSDNGRNRETGSDGGVHNFMKMLENWGGQTLMYRGSMVSLYFSRQAVGIYRADANIYSPPSRGYNFDTDFLSPPLLPPGTPMFRDINTLKFRQILRPNQ